MTFTCTGPKQLTGIIQKRSKNIGRNITYRVWFDDNTQEDVKMVDMKFRDEQLAPQPLYRKLTKADREKMYGTQSSSEDEDSKCDLDPAHLDEGEQEDLDPLPDR